MDRHIVPSSSSSSSPNLVDKKVFAVILEWLKYNQFKNTLECLEAEYNRKITRLSFNLSETHDQSVIGMAKV